MKKILISIRFMKILLSSILAAIMILSLSACGSTGSLGLDGGSGSSGANNDFDNSGSLSGDIDPDGGYDPSFYDDNHHGSTTPTTPSPPSLPVDPNERGNTVSNLLNGGIAVYHDGWIYFTDVYTQTMVKMRADGSDKTVLENGVGYGNLNIVGDWIYFLSANRVHKMRTDGTDKSVVSYENYSMRVESMTVVGEWIYYTSSEWENEGIFKLKTDGTEEIKLLDEAVREFSVVDGWIYYVGEYRQLDDDSYGHPFIRMKTDGSESSQIELIDCDIEGLTTQVLRGFIVDGDWIYATSNFLNFSGVFKFRIDGTDATNLGGVEQSQYFDIALADGFIYYYVAGIGADYDLYKVGIDGGEHVKLATNRYFLNINIVGDWIFFRGLAEGSYQTDILKMRTDGSGGFVLVGTPAQ
ncbi:MAG: DUF5050 domain-containing protein [Lachnospiraceae bacterium]|jgi:hypothetical protein|nr:DUF5050 domain-containing protein [Lachnospiraceae bacterium]